MTHTLGDNITARHVPVCRGVATVQKPVEHQNLLRRIEFAFSVHLGAGLIDPFTDKLEEGTDNNKLWISI